jgi:pimeloyl-CoA dehydrogenase
MDLSLTPDQRAFRDEVRAFITDRLPADIRERLRAGHPPRKQDTVAWQRILNERGWAAPHWPKRFGGADLGQLERLILLDEIYRDLASLRTSARKEGGHYVVNGQKIWTTTAHVADWVFALVRTDNEARKQEGISFLLIDLKTPGITIRPIHSIDGEHHLNEVFFDDVRVPVEHLVGQENRGWDCAKYLLGNERTGIANVGLCRERLDYARELAAKHTQGGRPLLDDPKLRSELALLDAETRALEITNWRFLLTDSEQKRLPAFASVLKLKGVELQQEINALLARIVGPGGIERRPSSDVVHGPVTPRYFYSRAASIYGGTSEVQKDILAKAIVG